MSKVRDDVAFEARSFARQRVHGDGAEQKLAAERHKGEFRFKAAMTYHSKTAAETV